MLAEKCDGVYVYAATDSVQAAPVLGGTGNAVTVTAEGATIYYTVDGTDPRYSASRELVASGGTVNITTGQTLRAYAYTDSKYPSGIVEKAAV